MVGTDPECASLGGGTALPFWRLIQPESGKTERGGEREKLCGGVGGRRYRKDADEVKELLGEEGRV